MSASVWRRPTGTRRTIRIRTGPTRRERTSRTGHSGAGPHVGLGMPLARMETTVAINALFDRLPGLHLDPAASQPVIKGVAFRSPAAFPVVFTPA
jgi:cytochrome P450